jgi:tetratricopeptide (TPR) repeat protein
LKARGYEAVGDLESAVKETEAGGESMREIVPDIPVAFHDNHGHILALSGRTEEAEELAEELRQVAEQVGAAQMRDYWWLLGQIELAKGNPDTAVVRLRKAVDLADAHEFRTRFSLAQALVAAGRYVDAIAVLEKRLHRYDERRAGSPIRAVKMHYLLGMAFEESGRPGRAIEHYETFLEIWKDADPGIPEVDDAKRRLERLKEGA